MILPFRSTLVLLWLLAPAALPAEELTIDHAGQPLVGTWVAAGEADDPLAILVAGSGPTDRDGNQPSMRNDSLKRLAQGLADAGIASFRYDKRSIGASKSELREEDLRVSTFADDLAAVARDMNQRHPQRPVWLIGHSEGSLMALLAAEHAPVAGIVSLAGAGRDAVTVLTEQLTARAPRSMVEEAQAIMTELSAGRRVSEISPPMMSLFRPSVQPYLISWFELDPAKLAGELDLPILAVQGTTDLQISPDDACRLAESGDHVRVVLIEGMNHVLREVEGGMVEQTASYTDPSLPLHEDLVPTVVAFIRGEPVGDNECASAAAMPAASLSCEGHAQFAGDWSGVIQPIGLSIVFDLDAGADGCLSGTFDSPDQGGFELPLSSIAATGDQLQIEANAFGIRYVGELEADGTIDGTFSQGGAEFMLDLTRGAAAATEN